MNTGKQEAGTEPGGLASGRLLYLRIPEGPGKELSRRAGQVLDCSVPLPAELPPGVEYPGPESLTTEMILSGILRDLAVNPEGPNSAYYRKLFLAVRPGIFGELEEAALLKARGGDYGTALEIIALLEGLYPQNPRLFLDRALVLEQRALSMTGRNGAGDAAGAFEEAAFEEAGAAYERALAFSGPAFPDALFHAAFFYEQRSDYRRSLDCIRSWFAESAEEGDEGNEDDEGDENGENGRAEKRRRAGELFEAITKNGLDDEGFAGALALIRQGEEEKGILKVKEFLERRPGAGRGWFLLGWGLRRLSRWEDGAACFEKALELGCANADARNELAICCMESGSLDRAGKELEKALALEPDNVKIISNMGILAMKKGEDDRAAAFFRTVLELDPADPVASAFFGQCSVLNK